MERTEIAMLRRSLRFRYEMASHATCTVIRGRRQNGDGIDRRRNDLDAREPGRREVYGSIGFIERGLGEVLAGDGEYAYGCAQQEENENQMKSLQVGTPRTVMKVISPVPVVNAVLGGKTGEALRRRQRAGAGAAQKCRGLRPEDGRGRLSPHESHCHFIHSDPQLFHNRRGENRWVEEWRPAGQCIPSQQDRDSVPGVDLCG
jgi:hypothetical protein